MSGSKPSIRPGSSPVDDAALQRYFDGEATAEERTRVEAALQHDPDAQARFEALTQMGALLRETVDAREQGASINVWAAVRDGIRQPAPVGERFGKRWFVPLGAAALAAAVLFFVLGQPDRPPEIAQVPSAPGEPATRPVQAAGQGSPVVEIESIETELGVPTIVMTVAQAGQAAIPVVWIEEIK